MTVREGKHWKLVRRSEPVHNTIIKSVWSFKIKRLPSEEFTKHKVRKCAHSGIQCWGESYYKIHAPVSNWISVRFLLTMYIVLYLNTRSMDFKSDYSQGELKTDTRMDIPWGYKIEGIDNTKSRCLKLLSNWYGLKYGGFNWHD